MSQPLFEYEGKIVYNVDASPPREVSYGLSHRSDLPPFYINVVQVDKFLDADGAVIHTITNKYRIFESEKPKDIPFDDSTAK